MRTTSLKLSPALDRRLSDVARRRGTTRSAIVREALEAFLAARRGSIADLAGDLIGSLEGPGDLSTNPRHMDGYGR
jgi:predicted transcriptional regulator